MGLEGIDDWINLEDQCQTKHSTGKCTDPARYAIDRADGTTTLCCQQCLAGVSSGQGNRRIISIKRVIRARGRR